MGVLSVNRRRDPLDMHPLAALGTRSFTTHKQAHMRKLSAPLLPRVPVRLVPIIRSIFTDRTQTAVGPESSSWFFMAAIIPLVLGALALIHYLRNGIPDDPFNLE